MNPVVLLILGLVTGVVLTVAVFLWIAPGVFANKAIPNDRAAWIDTNDHESRCYYSTISGNWMGCVKR